jgi:serine phosphatase RsbU (regulator of sigma subunit)
VFGIIYADSPIADARFTEDHLKVLTTLASVAAIRVENARLVEQHVERERFTRELQLAREIQQRFQPTSAPPVPGYELQGISFPATKSAATIMILSNVKTGGSSSRSATCRAREPPPRF